MESRSRETTPTKEDLDFIVDDGYRHDEDPDYIPDEKYLVSGKEFKKLTQNAKKLGAESLDYSTRKKITNIWSLFQVEKKFILDRQNMLIILLIKTKKEEINILLELQRLRINKEN